jgi:iron complex outermembrane recepter protein
VLCYKHALMKQTILVLLTILLVVKGFSQDVTGRASVVITDAAKQPLEGATVEMRRVKDSILVKTEVTNKEGKAEFEKIKEGSYFFKSSFLGHTTQISESFTVTSATPAEVKPMMLAKSGKTLSDVVVNTKKPFLQKLVDRIVVNVEGSIVSAGSSALDVLERSPGVSVDQNDVIGLRGRQGVIIMIDGKVTPMAGADLANYLRGLPAAAIERIEIITNPSAKYDAAGNAGIIDIRMKKDQRMGTNGTFTIGYGQGVYPKANSGITLNHRNKKVNVFGNYNYGYRINLNHLLLDRNFYQAGQYNGGDLKDNYMKAPLHNHTVRGGMDYSPSSKTILGFVVSANFNDIQRTNRNTAIVLDQQRRMEYTFNTNASSKDAFSNMVANVNVKHKFDSTGKELTADADYGIFRSDAFSSVGTTYYSVNGGTFKPDYILNGDQDGKLTIKTAKADYVNPLKGAAKFEIGFKTSHVASDNDAKFFDFSTGSPVRDTEKTNHFFYDEYNNAGYLNFSKEAKKFSVQIGLRGEHTKVNTFQVRNSVRWDSSYFQIFPSAFFNYKIGENKTLGVSVSRRIDRPGYSQLNPFLFLIDITTYTTGAPGLLPQFTWSYELSYTLKQLNFTLGYSHTKNNQSIVLARWKDVFPNIPQAENVTVQIPVNLESSDYVGLTTTLPIKVKSWWNMINNADIYYIHYNGNLANTPLNNGSPAARVSMNNTFTLKKGWTTELNLNYNSRVRSGYMVLEPQWGLSAGVQKNIMKNKGTLRFNVTDIFWTNLPKAVITYNNYIEKWHAYRETRVANLTFSYRFGNNKVAAARKRTTASEEERRRAGN